MVSSTTTSPKPYEKMPFLGLQMSYHENTKCNVLNEIPTSGWLSNDINIQKYYCSDLRAMALGQYYHKKTLTDTTEAKDYNSYITKTLRNYVMVLGKPFHGSLNLNDRRLLDFDFRSRKRKNDFQGLQEVLFLTSHLTKKLLACSEK